MPPLNTHILFVMISHSKALRILSLATVAITALSSTFAGPDDTEGGILSIITLDNVNSGLAKMGSGTLTLSNSTYSGSNTYNGTLTIDSLLSSGNIESLLLIPISSDSNDSEPVPPSTPPPYIDIPQVPDFITPPPPFEPPSIYLWTPYSGNMADRIHENAELLALRESDFLLDQQIYTEISNDLELIYDSIPSLSAATTRPAYLTSNVLVSVTEEIDLQIANGSYAPWNELKALYGGSIHKRYDWSSGITYSFVFDSILDSQLLAQQIEASWVGIKYAYPNFYVGDSHDIIRYPGTGWYAFTAKWGDCPSGCINSNTRLVAIENGSVNLLDPHEILDRIEFLGLNANPLRAASGDKISTSTIKAHFNLKAFPETFLETNVQLQYKNAQSEWINIHYAAGIQQSDFSKECRAIVNYPYDTQTVTLPFTLEETTSRTKDVFGSRFRHPDNWIEQADLGWINDRKYPWLWHTQLGWLYLDEASSSENAWWTYDRQLGWLWLPLSDLYPYIWANDRWLWYQEGSSHPRWFFDYNINQWISID